ncbi:AAEL009897-PA [Aedes aegypti]|uniref:AAEL009897-PA n=1 Tax=Aedes aegypti TaxID=7159 RepID=Q16UJ1_AEDAE|nr:AAEL009897-PA [Aedes aegypti]
MTEELTKRFDKKESDVIHSYKFWTRRQGQYEKAIDFVLAVKQLAEECDFGGFKERDIRDVLVIGVLDRQLQKRLFDEDDLTASKAERIIVNQEISSDRTRYLKEDDDKRTSTRGNVIARLGARVDRSRVRFERRSRSRSRSYGRDRSFSRGGRRNRRFEERRENNGFPRGQDDLGAQASTESAA